MRLCLVVMLLASAATVSACSRADPKPVIRVETVRPVVPEVARKPCNKPVPLPDRDMTAREVTTSWGADRSALLTCEERRAAGVAASEGPN